MRGYKNEITNRYCVRGIIPCAVLLNVCFFNVSCDGEAHNKNLRQQYFLLNDEMKTLQKQKDSVINRDQMPLENQLAALQNEAGERTALYEEKIKTLRNRIYEAETKNTAAFNHLSRRQEALHGHAMTPGYQKALNLLEEKKQKEVAVYTAQIRQMNQEMDADSILREKMNQVKKITNALKEVRTKVHHKYDKRIALLQQQMKAVESANAKK